MLPGASPPLISWHVRQLPLPRSKARSCPFERLRTRDCAIRHAENTADDGRQHKMRLSQVHLFLPAKPVALVDPISVACRRAAPSCVG